MHPLQKIRQRAMRPINRQAAGVLKDSLYDTFGMVRPGRKEAAGKAKIEGELFLFDGYRYKCSWSLEQFARANDLEWENPRMVRAILKVVRTAHATQLKGRSMTKPKALLSLPDPVGRRVPRAVCGRMIHRLGLDQHVKSKHGIR